MDSRHRLQVIFAVICLMAVPAFAVTPDDYDQHPLSDDLVLPMPNGARMVFRPVFLGSGTGRATREFRMGDRTGQHGEEPMQPASVGGSFIAERDGHQDWLFYVGKYSVTEAQFDAVCAVPGGQKEAASQSCLPQTNLTRREMDDFVDQYNAWLLKNAPGQLPEYSGARGFLRLPTEDEWEFAARGGSAATAAFFEAATPYEGELQRYEWFGGTRSSFGKLKAVGLLEPNPLGLYDMLGNAAQMTDTMYQFAGRTGGYTVRGGSFRTPEEDIRASLRTEQPRFGRDNQPMREETVGFRLVIASQIFTDQNRSEVNALKLALEKREADEEKQNMEHPQPSPVRPNTNVTESGEFQPRSSLAIISSPSPVQSLPESDSAIGAPSPSASSSSPTDPATFVEGYVNSLGSNNVERPLAYFGETVAYYDNGNVGTAFLRNDLEHDTKKWSDRRYSILGGAKILQNADGYTAKFVMNYTLNNPTEIRNGRLAMNVRLQTQGQSLKIMGIHAKVISAHRQTPVAAQPSAMPANAEGVLSAATPSNQSPRLSPVPSESGPDNLQNAAPRLYKVGELKKLVGKRLQNAYLSGSFICLAVQGSGAGFHSYKDRGFGGQAIPQVAETEFQQGTLSLESTEVLVIFSKPPQIHYGMALHFGADSPIKIVSVSAALDGHYIVYARDDD